MAFHDTSGQMVVSGTWPNVQVSDPNNLFTSGSVSHTTAGDIHGQPLTFLNNVTQGVSAKELSSIVDSIGSVGSSVSNGIGKSMSEFMDLIKKNTAENNAWSAEQAAKQNAWQERQNQIAMDFNAAEAAKNRDWQEMMSNTAHQREIADLQAAGLNPVLSASGGNGAAVTSGATASGVTSSGAKGDTDTSANSAIVGLLGSLISANASMNNAKVSAQANMYLGAQQIAMQERAQELQAQIALASQQNALNIAGINANNNYQIAQMNAENQRVMQQQQFDYNQRHPSNAWQAASSGFNNPTVQAGVNTLLGIFGLPPLTSASGVNRRPSNHSSSSR